MYSRYLNVLTSQAYTPRSSDGSFPTEGFFADPDVIGAEAAVKRAAAKAVARDRAAGLEPVIRTRGENPQPS